MASPSSPAVLLVSGRRPPPYDVGAWVRRRGGRPVYAASLFEALQAVVRESPALTIVLPGAGLGGSARLRRLLRVRHPGARVLVLDPEGSARRFVFRVVASCLGAAGPRYCLVGGARP